VLSPLSLICPLLGVELFGWVTNRFNRMERNAKIYFGVPTKDGENRVDYAKIYVFNTNTINPKELFSPYLKNRGGREDAIAKHVQEIRDGILKDGGMDNIPPIIIDINTLQIVDGNCRFNALLSILNDELLDNIKLRVIFEDIPEENFDERVIQYNQGQKSWTTVDFIYNYKLRGYDSFDKLIKFCESDDTLHTKDGKINPRYAAAALRVSANDLKKSTLTITDADVELGRKVVYEAAEVRKKFSEDAKANGGGWYEPYLRAWAEFRGGLGEVSFKDYLRAVGNTVKNRKRDNPVPYGSNKKSEWFNFFSGVLLREFR
jgi:hypothetical protein